MEMDIKNIYTKNLITVRELDHLSVADELMSRNQIRHLPVVNESGYLVGMLSRSDFNALKNVNLHLKDLKVKSFMSSPVKVFNKTTTVKSVAQYFINEKINSAVIVGFDEIIGILTSEDLLRLIAQDDYLEFEADFNVGALADDGWISRTAVM